MKKLIPILLCLVLAISASAYVYDNADLYTDEEEAIIASEAEAVYAQSGLRCVILTDFGIGDITAELPEYTEGAVDMALLTIDMSAREFYLYQYNGEDGESAFRISTDESDDVLDGILPDMADGEYLLAALSYLEMTAEAFANEDVFTPAVTDDEYVYVEYPEYGCDVYEEPQGFDWEVLCMLVVGGAVVGGIVVLCVWLSYKKKVHGAIYPLGEYANLQMRETRDNYIHTTHTRVRISDSSSGSHHGGGGGFSGGSRGGGGGARMGGRKF